MSTSRNQRKNLILMGLVALAALGAGVATLALLSRQGSSGTDPFGFFPAEDIQDAALPKGSDPTRFDPVASYPQVQAFAADGAELIDIEAMYVRADGTVNLNASYMPRVLHRFGLRIPPPTGAPPVGAGAPADGKFYQPIYVDVYGTGRGRDPDEGMQRDVTPGYFSVAPTIAKAPVCSFAKLWDAAIEKGVPGDAVAKIEYDFNSYEFTIAGTFIRLSFDLDCHITRAEVPTVTPEPTATKQF